MKDGCSPRASAAAARRGSSAPGDWAVTLRTSWVEPGYLETDAAWCEPDGTGEMLVARTPGIADVINAYAPGLAVTEVDLPGPPTSAEVRGAGWTETAVLLAAAVWIHRGTPPEWPTDR